MVAIDRLLAERRELMEALERYGCHLAHCRCGEPYQCGWDKLRALLGRGKGAE